MLNHELPLDRVFHALADPGRLAIIARLSEGPASVGDLAGPLSMSTPRALQHLKVLEETGLIASEKAGRVRTCRLAPTGLARIADWTEARRRGLETRLDRLGAYLDSTGDKT
ncbi:MAG: metalloregulator ArsR/SmtB family transcription factor [Pseudomonadota bacterium]